MLYSNELKFQDSPQPFNIVPFLGHIFLTILPATCLFIYLLRVCVCVCFLGPYMRHMEVPRLWVESELQLPAYAAATATQDPSCVCNLHHSSWQHRIRDPMSEARDRNHTLMETSWVCFCCATTGTPVSLHLRSI